MVDNVQDARVRYAGMTHAQRSFVNKTTWIKMLEWLNVSSSDMQLLKSKKNDLMDKLRVHTPHRHRFHNYIKYLPYYLPKDGAVRTFLNEMCK